MRRWGSNSRGPLLLSHPRDFESHRQVNGAGKYSVDQQLLGGEIELYKKGLNAVGFDPDSKYNNPFLTVKEQKRREKTGRYY